MINRELKIGEICYSASVISQAIESPSFTDDKGQKWIQADYITTYKRVGIITKHEVIGIVIPTIEGVIPPAHADWQNRSTYYVIDHGVALSDGTEQASENDPNWPRYFSYTEDLFETFAEAEEYQNELLNN